MGRRYGFLQILYYLIGICGDDHSWLGFVWDGRDHNRFDRGWWFRLPCVFNFSVVFIAGLGGRNLMSAVHVVSLGLMLCCPRDSASADSWVLHFQIWIVSIGLILVATVNFNCFLLKARVDLWIDDLSGWSRGLFLLNRMGHLDLGLLPFAVGYWARIGL